MTRSLPLWLLLPLLGCPPTTDDTGTGDADADADADSDADADADVPLDGFGDITGDCGVLDDELTETTPSLFENHIDFADMAFDYDALSEGGKKVHDDGNLGGSSLHSEIFAYEVLHRCEMAALLETEGDISYDTEGSKTDVLVDIDGNKIGVSITRAFRFPAGTPFEVSDGTDLLTDKLGDILESSDNVSAEDAWTKQILGVVAYDQTAADSISTAWDGLDSSVTADTVVYVTVTDGTDDWIY